MIINDSILHSRRMTAPFRGRHTASAFPAKKILSGQTVLNLDAFAACALEHVTHILAVPITRNKHGRN